MPEFRGCLTLKINCAEGVRRVGRLVYLFVLSPATKALDRHTTHPGDHVQKSKAVNLRQMAYTKKTHIHTFL